ncbi:MAG: phenylalanine--tRNA ligase subunit beta [bacterium]
MKISLDWLKEFVSWQGSAEELAENLTCLGLNVEGLEEYIQSFPGVVVGKVLDAQPHPNADRLRLCSVFDGEQELAVVCGATNVRAGLNVLLARPGANLPGGLKIKRSTIRGQESFGMICSAIELGLGADATGIMELADDLQPGQAADTLYGFKDVVFDIEVTPNRPDWLSHLGVAREVAALGGTKVTPPRMWKAPKSGGEHLDFNVEIEDFNDCPRYTAHAARGVVVSESPQFIQNRLRAVGARPINNIVDITNYVMFELGQPLHAFDRAKLCGNRLFIRRADSGAKVSTLDDIERELGSDHLVIADANGAIAIAGVMGGANSGVDENTQEILLESAFFQPRLVRQTARALGLATESSYRFERRADWDMVLLAAQRVLFLFQEFAAARIVPEYVDRQNPDRNEKPSIPLRISQVNRLLGTSLTAGEAASLLQTLSLKVVPLGGASDPKSSAASLMVEVPTFRRDLALEVDLIEEIARLYGYDRIVGEGRFRGGSGGKRLLEDRISNQIRQYLANSGYHEMATSSFFEQHDLDKLNLHAGDTRSRPLGIANPFHGGGTLMRTSLLPSLLRVTRHNINAESSLPLRLYQINKVFLPEGEKAVNFRHEDEILLPAESLLLQIGLVGEQGTGLGGLPKNLLELKGLINNLAQLIRQPLDLQPQDHEPFLADGQQWRLMDQDGRQIGSAGAVLPAVLADFEIELPMAVVEMEMGKLVRCQEQVSYRPFSRFPAVKRDLSLLVPRTVSFARLEEVVLDTGGDLLDSLELFDIYRGNELPNLTSALGIRLKFRSDKGNLKGKIVDKSIARIEKALAEGLDVRIRS